MGDRLIRPRGSKCTVETPPQSHSLSMEAPSLDVAFSADWNVFGYDPNGLLAHLVGFFYGDWFPDTFDHLPRWVGEVQPPRYGSPGPQQVSSLPKGWRQTAPPLYYGVPSGPYLPPPRKFQPSAFASLIYPHPRVPLKFESSEARGGGGEVLGFQMEQLCLMTGQCFS